VDKLTGCVPVGLRTLAQMVKRVKIMITLGAALMAFFSTRAQPDTAAVPRTVAFPGAIEAVLHDFPNNLRHITGELLLAQGEIDSYVSTIEPPGAESCVITRYHSHSDSTASWQAKMYSGEDFDRASSAYHAIYKQLQSCYLLLPDSSMVFLKGQWEPAREDIAFTTSTLRLNTGDERYQEVQVDLELLYQVSHWVVNINIVSKRPDDEIGGLIRSTQ
jgi:hypothetical protein